MCMYIYMYTNSVSVASVYSVIASSRIIAVGAQQLAYLLQVFDDEPSSYSHLITDITSTGRRIGAHNVRARSYTGCPCCSVQN